MSDRESENTVEYPAIGSKVLTDFQIRLTDSLRRSKAVSVSAPTSAGKSFVLAHDILTSISEKPGTVLVYLVPTRALIQQVTNDLLSLFREAELGDVIVSAAPIDFTAEQAKPGLIYVLTQERLVSLLAAPEFELTVRISTGTRDDEEAEQQKAELEARLLLGLSISTGRGKVLGSEMEWSDFREQFRTLHLAMVRDSTALHAESRLDLAERILKPKTLGDMADPNALQQLQAKLLAGEQSRRKEAKIEVESADARTGRLAKYASAHDLRRSCGERLRNVGVPPLVICRVMRHSSSETTRKHYAPGDVQKDAKVLSSCLRTQSADR